MALQLSPRNRNQDLQGQQRKQVGSMCACVCVCASAHQHSKLLTVQSIFSVHVYRLVSHSRQLLPLHFTWKMVHTVPQTSPSHWLAMSSYKRGEMWGLLHKTICRHASWLRHPFHPHMSSLFCHAVLLAAQVQCLEAQRRTKSFTGQGVPPQRRHCLSVIRGWS